MANQEQGRPNIRTVAQQRLEYVPQRRRRSRRSGQRSGCKDFSPCTPSPLGQPCWSQESVPTPPDSDSSTSGLSLARPGQGPPAGWQYPRPAGKALALQRVPSSTSNTTQTGAPEHEPERRNIRELTATSTPDYADPRRPQQPPIGFERGLSPEQLRTAVRAPRTHDAQHTAPMGRPYVPCPTPFGWNENAPRHDALPPVETGEWGTHNNMVVHNDTTNSQIRQHEDLQPMDLSNMRIQAPEFHYSLPPPYEPSVERAFGRPPAAEQMHMYCGGEYGPA